MAWSVVRARRSHPACATGRGRVGRRAVRMREMAVRVRRPWGRTWRQEERRGRRWCRKGREGRWQHRAAPGERLRGVTVGELREEGRVASLVKPKAYHPNLHPNPSHSPNPNLNANLALSLTPNPVP